MADDVMTAEPVAAPVESAPQDTASFAEVMAKWTPDERRQWALTGEEPAAAEPAAKDSPAEPVANEPKSGAKPEPKADSEPAVNEPDEDDDLPDDPGKQKKAFARIRRERAFWKGQAKAYETQIASQKTAPAASASPQLPSQSDGQIPEERPKRPRMSDPKYSVEGGAELYDADFDKYEDAIKVYESKLRKVAEAVSTTGRLVSAAADLAKDPASFAKTPVTWPLVSVLTGMRDGAAVLAYLGDNLSEAEELASATDILGNLSYEKAVERADSDPALARQFGAAEAIVRSRAAEILKAIKNPPVQPPKPVTVTRAPAPGSRVAAASTVPADPIESAYASGNFALAAKLEAQRDMDRYKTRG